MSDISDREVGSDVNPEDEEDLLEEEEDNKGGVTADVTTPRPDQESDSEIQPE